MVELYLPLKWLHVVSATILFGTGLGTAFHFWHALRTGSVGAIAASPRRANATVPAPARSFARSSAAGSPSAGLLSSRYWPFSG